MILPRASRHPEPKFSPEPPKSPEYPRFNRYPDAEPQKFREPTKQDSRPRYERYDSNERTGSWKKDKEYYQKYQEENKFKYENEGRRVERYDSGFKEQKHSRNGSKGYRDDFEEEIEYREKKKDEIVPRPRSKYIPDERFYQDDKRKFTDEFYQNESKQRYYEGEREKEKIRTRYPPNDPRFYSDYEDKRKEEKEYYRNPKYQQEDRYYQENKSLEKPQKKFNAEDPRFYSDTRQSEKSSRSKYSQEDPRQKYQDDFFDDHPESRRRAEDRQRSPSPPEENASPKERFKDAKEKFLLLERERHEEERNRREILHTPSNIKDKTFLKRHESMIIPKERYHEERRYEIEPRYQPKPAPRTMVAEEEVRYRRDVPLDRYRPPEERFEPRDRRSMYNQVEEEHKKNSNEIARELKRRSYMEPDYHKEKYDIPENRRHPGVDREGYSFSKSNIELDKVPEKYNQRYEPKIHQKFKQPAGYRHSYAEPKMSMERVLKKHHNEMVHRTNSTVSNSGRVGIASVTPY